MTVGIKKRQATRLGLAVALVIAPLAHGQDSERIHVAAAIGAETKPAPAQPASPPQGSQGSSVPTSGGEPAGEGGFSSAEIWLGVGVAAFLAAVGGGGGGGGGGSTSTTQHNP